MPEPSAERAAHIVVHGRVQGVGFRAWVHHQAELRGLHGWVRNRRDGTVEAYFRGPEHTVEAMLEVCRTGPSGARVDRIEPLDRGEARSDDGEAQGFSVLKTV